MRAARPLLALALLVAGCLGDPGEPPAEGVVLPAGPSGFVRPEPGSGTAWVRAYWEGREEVVLVDESFVTGAGLVAGPDWCEPCGGGLYTAGETLVAPGTAALEVTAEYDPRPHAGLRFVYDSGRGGEAERLLLAPGETLVLETTPDMWDAPLQPRSHWWFGFFPHAEPAGPVPPMEVSVRVVARRAAEVPEVSEPADPWRAGDALPLVSPERARAHASLVTPVGGGCLPGGCNGLWWTSDPGGLVPAGAVRVRATLSWEGTLTGGVPELYAWTPHLEFAAFSPVEEGSSSVTYEVEAPPEWWDAPYQTRSLWWLAAALPAGAHDATFRLEATALRA